MPRQTYIHKQQVPALYAEARATFESYKLEDLTEEHSARVMVDTILSQYVFDDDDVIDAARTFGATLKDAKADVGPDGDGNYYALEDGADKVADFINRNLPRDAVGYFFFNWEDGGYYLCYGVDIEE